MTGEPNPDQRPVENAFDDELDAIIKRFVDNYDITIGQLIGVLEMKKLEIYNDVYHQEDE